MGIDLVISEGKFLKFFTDVEIGENSGNDDVGFHSHELRALSGDCIVAAARHLIFPLRIDLGVIDGDLK